VTELDTSDPGVQTAGSAVRSRVPGGHEPVRDLLGRLGLAVAPDLFDRALTHRSYAYERGGLPTNERLEFLGDSVLGLVVTEHLFVCYPDLSEGQLAKLRAAVVNSRALADVGRRLELGSLLYLGRGEESTGGRDKSSILADTMEAVIGSVFLEHGVDGARRFVHHLFDALMADAATRGAGLDWKTSLQEVASLGGHGVPVYEVRESGPDHAKTFSATVAVGERTYGPGTGRNKKEAEQKAAALAFAAIAPQALTAPITGVVGA
jgi:ribonuclease-3